MDLLQSHFCSVSWMCKKQTSVSHSSTESEIFSLDAGSRMDGIPALDIWDLVIEVLLSSSKHVQGHQDRARVNLQCNKPSSKHTNTQIKIPIQHNDIELTNVDYMLLQT